MQIFHGVPEEPLASESALTVGVFDGVHRGHQALLVRTRERASEHGRSFGVVTFDPHPAEVLASSMRIAYLSDLDERIYQFERCGADFCCLIHFTTLTAATAARDFVAPLFQRLRMRNLVIGYDFTLGHKRQGNASFLQALGAEWGFTVDVIEPQRIDGEVVSSTRIRKFVTAGDVATAARLLGHPLAIHGTLSQQMHVQAAARLLLPPDGIYRGAVAPIYSRTQPISARLKLTGHTVEISRAKGLELLEGSAMRVEFFAPEAQPPFEEVEHTADVALRVRGKDFKELLLHSAQGMGALMAAPDDSALSTEREIAAHGDDPETLLVNWLNEILFQTEVTACVFRDFQVELEPDYGLHAIARGSKPKEFRKQIKAVTFHDLHIDQQDGEYETLIVFDI